MAESVTHHGQLTADTVATLAVDCGGGTIEVVNRSGTAEIYFTIGPTLAATPAPTVEGEGCFVVPEALVSYVAHGSPGVATVKLISTGTPKYSVIGGQP